MAEYLWGVAQLVNDPSSHVLNLIRKGFSSQTRHKSTCKAKEHKELNTDTSNSVNNLNDKEIFLSEVASNKTAEASCSYDLDTKKLISKYVQVGQPICKCHVSVQSQKRSPCVDKTTSAHVQSFSRSTVTCGPTSKRDGYSEPIRQMICENHREVFNILKNWDNIYYNVEKNEKNPIALFKGCALKFLKFFRIDKIQNLPEYHGSEKNNLQLYREISYIKLE